MDQIIYSAHQWFLACYIISWLWQGHEISPWSKYFSPSVMDCTVLCVKVPSILLVEMKIISQTRDRKIFYFFWGPAHEDLTNEMTWLGALLHPRWSGKKKNHLLPARWRKQWALAHPPPKDQQPDPKWKDDDGGAIRQKRSCWKGNFGMWKEDG